MHRPTTILQSQRVSSLWLVVTSLVGPACFAPERLGAGDGASSTSTGDPNSDPSAVDPSAGDPSTITGAGDDGTPVTADPGTGGTHGESGSETGDPHAGCTSDAECDDANPCSNDTCDAGTCTHMPVVDDPKCTCGTADECTNLPASDDCRTRRCDDGVCVLELVESGEPAGAAMQQTGDCSVVVCDGLGGTRDDADVADVPIDGLECTDDVCDGIEPSNPAVRDGLRCSAGACEGGVCMGCTDASQCPGGGACEAAACVAGACTIVPAEQGLECDDGLFCTAVDTCDGAGACTGIGSPCPGPDGDNNCNESCNEDTDACNGFDAEGSPCNDGQFCTVTDTCNGGGFCQGVGDPCPGPDGDFDCTESCAEATDSCTEDDPAGSSCGGECNVCDVNGSCDVFGPGQCP